MLRHLAVHDAEPVRLLDGETIARRRDAPQLALVRAAARAAHCDRLPIRGGLLDVETVVGEDSQQPLHYVPLRRDSAPVFWGGHAVEVVLRHDLLEVVEVVVVPDLFYHAAHHGLVRSFRHGPSLLPGGLLPQPM
jgi:hypothetical protein